MRRTRRSRPEGVDNRWQEGKREAPVSFEVPAGAHPVPEGAALVLPAEGPIGEHEEVREGAVDRVADDHQRPAREERSAAPLSAHVSL